jgi:hypothetical protein
MARRTRNSNRPEYCPLCLRRLAARHAAASHYRAHVRKGELVEVGTRFRIAQPTSEMEGAAWSRGFQVGASLPDERDIRRARDTYLFRAYRNPGAF